MKHSLSLRSLATISVVSGVVGAARRAARVFSPELDLTTTERVTLAYLTLRCGSAPLQGGVGHASLARIQDIATATGRSTRTARYACRSLEAKGFIASELKPRGSRLPNGLTADRETLVVRSARDLKATKVAGLNGAITKAFHHGLRGADGKPLTASRRAVLAVLLIHAGEDGWCWPAYETLAAMTGLTTRTVGSAVRELMAVGHLTRRLIPPTWGDPGWKIHFRPTPTLIHKPVANAGKAATPASLPGNGFLPPRQPLPTKEIREADPSARPAAPVQLDMFVPTPGSRAAEIEAVVKAAQRIDGVTVAAEQRERVQARLGEGVHADDIVEALRVAATHPGTKVDLVTRVTRSKAVILAYLEKVGKGDRLRQLERGVVDVEADRAARDAGVRRLEGREEKKVDVKKVLDSFPARPIWERRA